jgi:hypothetical protein
MPFCFHLLTSASRASLCSSCPVVIKPAQETPLTAQVLLVHPQLSVSSHFPALLIHTLIVSAQSLTFPCSHSLSLSHPLTSCVFMCLCALSLSLCFSAPPPGACRARGQGWRAAQHRGPGHLQQPQGRRHGESAHTQCLGLFVFLCPLWFALSLSMSVSVLPCPFPTTLTRHLCASLCTGAGDQRGRPQGVVHRVDGCGQAADGSCLRHRQAHVHGAGACLREEVRKREREREIERERERSRACVSLCVYVYLRVSFCASF